MIEGISATALLNTVLGVDPLWFLVKIWYSLAAFTVLSLWLICSLPFDNVLIYYFIFEFQFTYITVSYFRIPVFLYIKGWVDSINPEAAKSCNTNSVNYCTVIYNHCQGFMQIYLAYRCNFCYLFIWFPWLFHRQCRRLGYPAICLLCIRNKSNIMLVPRAKVWFHNPVVLCIDSVTVFYTAWFISKFYI